MKWIDSQDIAIALEDAYPQTNILQVRFTQLREWVLALPNFQDDPQRCNEKVLEAIQMAWLEERDER